MSRQRTQFGDTGAEPPGCSRRSVLRRGIATVGLATSVGGVAAAQSESPTETPVESPEAGITTRAVTLEQEDFPDLAGFFLHVEGEASPIEASVADACDYVNWRDERTSAYDVVLLDRSQADVPQRRTTLYLRDDVPVPPGALWVVNHSEQCSEGYLGIELEQIGATKLEAGLSGDLSPTETPGGEDEAIRSSSGIDSLGADVGFVGALGALFGSGWLRARRRENE